MQVIKFLQKHPDLDETRAEMLLCWIYLVGQGILPKSATLSDTNRFDCDNCAVEGNCPLTVVKDWGKGYAQNQL